MHRRGWFSTITLSNACTRLGDGGIVVARDRLRVEEVAAVVELDVAAGGRRASGVVDLCWDRSRRDGLVRRVLPQVAHQAAERALAIGQEDRRNVDDFARRRALGLDEEGPRHVRIDAVLRPAGRQNLRVADVQAEAQAYELGEAWR